MRWPVFMLTCAQLVDYLEHAVGKTPDSRHLLIDTLNRAGRALTTITEWSWRDVTATIPVVASQNYVDLPQDFGACKSITVPDSGTYTEVRVVPPETIDHYRRLSGVNLGGVMLVSLSSFSKRLGKDQPMRPRAELFPTPTVAASPTFTLRYDAKWVEMTTADDGAVAGIPGDFEQALLDAARMFAKATEDGDGAPMPDITQIPEVKRLMGEDGRRQGTSWAMSGGASRFMDERYDRPDVYRGSAVDFTS